MTTAAAAIPLEYAFEVRIKGRIEAVWQEITKRGAVQRPVMDSVLFSDLKPGSPFKYTDASGKYSMVKGTILEIDPPRRLVHTYQFSHLQDPPSRVTWELQQAGEEVIVRLVHDKFEKPTKTYQMVKGGWKEILDNLKLWMETGDIAFSTKFKYAMFRPLIPILCKKD